MLESDTKAVEVQRRGARHSFALPELGLTPREVQVCERLIEGLALKEVAFQLNISVNTADYHRCNAYRKLNVHNRVELLKKIVDFSAPVAEPLPADTMADEVTKKLDSIEEQLANLFRAIHEKHSEKEESKKEP